MNKFAQLYETRADYVYFLCQRLEADEERVETLYLNVWRRVRRDLLQLSGVSEEKWLCQKLVESHRKMCRQHPREEDRQLEEGVMSALMGLSLEYRWPLVLKECVSFSYGELSEVLGIPESTVRTRIAGARSLLRRQLGEESF